jgi:hypothetical protein
MLSINVCAKDKKSKINTTVYFLFNALGTMIRDTARVTGTMTFLNAVGGWGQGR